MSPPLVSQRAEWHSLQEHYQQIKDVQMRDLFAQDPERGNRLKIEALDLYLDYSKNRITDETLRSLFVLTEMANLREVIDGMFGGERINRTEDRRAETCCWGSGKGMGF